MLFESVFTKDCQYLGNTNGYSLSTSFCITDEAINADASPR